jgi:hypothetical protein
VLVASCSVFRLHGASAPTYPLIVNNRSTFDVDIFAVPSEGALSLVRIGEARPMSTTNLVLSRNVLQPQEILQLQLHAIGSTRGVRSWRSPTQPLDSTLAATLDIRADPNGNLSKSALYAQPRELVKKP